MRAAAGGAAWTMAAVCALCAPLTVAAGALERPLAAQIDAVASEWLSSTRAPSVSIAIVRDGAVRYVKAYGFSRLRPDVAATPATRYAIDSLTKEFTAAAVLLCAERGSLSLDDPLSRWFPALDAAAAVSLRQLLNHTSGIRDYWPQDFVTPEMTRPTTPAALIEEWAGRPLDFEPGTDWQYSNTNYVLAAAVVQQASGQAFFAFLEDHVFAPLGMTQVGDRSSPLTDADAVGYTRHGLGAVREAPRESPGWLFGAANLVMQSGELALWDVSLLQRSLLSARSYAAQLQPATLKNGNAVAYGLGLDVEQVQGRLRVGHAGGGVGYLAENRLWPQERVAIVVLTNSDWASPSELVDRIAFLVLPPSPALARAQRVFAALQSGVVDRSLFTATGNFHLSPAVLAELHASLGPLGPARDIELEQEEQRGGLVTRRWFIRCRNTRLEAIERGDAERLDEFMVIQKAD